MAGELDSRLLKTDRPPSRTPDSGAPPPNRRLKARLRTTERSASRPKTRPRSASRNGHTQAVITIVAWQVNCQATIGAHEISAPYLPLATFAIAAIWSGVVPQQPPIMFAPAPTSSQTRAAISDGVSLKTDLPFSRTGIPALA